MNTNTKKDSSVAVNNLRRIWDAKKAEIGVTQNQAAKELGWTQGAVAQYLNNITELNTTAIIKLANFLGVDPREIDPQAGDELPNYVTFNRIENTPLTINLADNYVAYKDRNGSIVLTPRKK